ncbi:MAG: hypothetical protein Q4G71_00770 [Pseudomonadota bacterium]|nr:hypothetical protein [Pseudomonadota bacterium]
MTSVHPFMRWRAAALLLGALGLFASARASETTVLHDHGLTVHAVIEGYAGPEGRRGSRGVLFAAWQGQRIAHEALSRSLFPAGHVCASAHYELQDLR